MPIVQVTRDEAENKTIGMEWRKLLPEELECTELARMVIWLLVDNRT